MTCHRCPDADATWSVRLKDGRTLALCGPCAAQTVERDWASSLVDLAAIEKAPEPAQ